MHIFIIHPSDLLTDCWPHGDGLLAHRFIVELAARGHRIDVACERADLARPMPPNVRVHELTLRGAGALRRLRHVAAIRELFHRLHRAEPFDLAHQLNPVTTALSLALVGTRVPLVLGPFVGHWPAPPHALSAIPRFIAGLQQRFAHAIVLSSEHAWTRVVAPERSSPRVHVVPYGIDVETFGLAQPAGGDPTILYLASVERRKGIFVLLDAFDRLAQHDPRVRLHVAGTGPDLAAARQYAASLPSTARIRFLGSIPRADVAATLASCAVFCTPSFGEPYGMAAIEAMATGRPVVVTTGGALAHIVDASGGRCVAPGDARALAAALAAVLADPARAAAMGAHNRSIVEHRFAWDRVLDQFEIAYAAARTAQRSPLPHRSSRVQSA